MRRLRLLSERLRELPISDTSSLFRQSGGKLKDAVVLSARAQSLLSPSEFLELRHLVAEPYLFQTFGRTTSRVAQLSHTFDVEHAKSLPLLNTFAAQLAGNSLRGDRAFPQQHRIEERASHLSDHLQGGDFAAGWAVDVLTSTDSDYRALAQKVRWITVNGLVIPG